MPQLWQILDGLVNFAIRTFKKHLNMKPYKNVAFFQLEEFLPIYAQAKKDKDQGCYEDFLECLKLYDKAENGLMLGAELTHTLLALGKRFYYLSTLPRLT